MSDIDDRLQCFVVIAALGFDRIHDLPEVGETLGRMYSALLAFASPAAIVVALRALVGLVKD
jgi:hypothetical protein